MNLVLVGLFMASIACDVAGQLSFKRATARSEAAVNRWVLLGVMIYAIEIVVWVRILSLVPLAVAFPVASLNFIAITLACRFWLGERVSPKRWAGTALVAVGVVLVAQGA